MVVCDPEENKFTEDVDDARCVAILDLSNSGGQSETRAVHSVQVSGFRESVSSSFGVRDSKERRKAQAAVCGTPTSPFNGKWKCDLEEGECSLMCDDGFYLKQRVVIK